ncbi:CBO0543 family protein [Paenibacillus silviterrae]|uniref:CBO0543 family protein n=2 Tax=Paenibacillus silviterrae TaxID=3242194 RepID=UPI002542D1BB|nr:CBO0543 family protein [Paenibacillus chinjuensis]
MTQTQADYFHNIVSTQERLTREGVNYWSLYSNFTTWQFWTILAMLIIPLILVYRFIDRTKIYQIAFFGFATHVLFAYTDVFGIRYGLWGYPYQVIPFLPSVSLDAALIPVAIMFVYQWTLKRGKNFHLYAVLTALAFGFGFKPLLVMFGLFEKYKWVNYFIIFLIYITLYEAAYLLTSLFSKMKTSNPKRQGRQDHRVKMNDVNLKLPGRKRSKVT